MLNDLLALDDLELNLGSGDFIAMNLILGFIMFGVALGIDPRDFRLLIRQPRSMWVGLSSQLILLPLITFLLLWLFGSNVSTGAAMGMILVASCPGGNISNFMAHLAGGNTALSVSLTAVSTLGALITTPLNFALWGTLYSRLIAADGANPLLRSLEIDPLEVGKTVFLLLGVPLLLGMLFARRFPEWTQKLHSPVRLTSILAFLAIVAVAFGKNFSDFLLHISAIFVLVLIHNLTALAGGWSWAKAWRLSKRNRRSITIETGIQNSGLGLVLIFNPAIFPETLPIGGMAAITGWWGIWHIIAGLSLAGWWHTRGIHLQTVQS